MEVTVRELKTLSAFASKDEWRANINAPWYNPENQTLCATDSYTAVCMQCPSSGTEPWHVNLEALKRYAPGVSFYLPDSTVCEPWPSEKTTKRIAPATLERIRNRFPFNNPPESGTRAINPEYLRRLGDLCKAWNLIPEIGTDSRGALYAELHGNDGTLKKPSTRKDVYGWALIMPVGISK